MLPQNTACEPFGDAVLGNHKLHTRTATGGA
jgi:hypothetical protein